MVKRESGLGKTTEKVAKWRCSLGLMVKLPAVGFMLATYLYKWIVQTTAKPPHVLGVVNLLESEFVPAVPVTVVNVLPDDRVRPHLHSTALQYNVTCSLCSPCRTRQPPACSCRPGSKPLQWSAILSIQGGWQYQFLVAWRAVVLPRLLLQRLLKDLLSHLRAVVEVERDVGDGVVLTQVAQSKDYIF